MATDSVRGLSALPVHFRVKVGRGSNDTHIVPENATNTPNLSNVLHVEDPETRPPLVFGYPA